MLCWCTKLMHGQQGHDATFLVCGIYFFNLVLNDGLIVIGCCYFYVNFPIMVKPEFHLRFSKLNLKTIVVQNKLKNIISNTSNADMHVKVTRRVQRLHPWARVVSICPLQQRHVYLRPRFVIAHPAVCPSVGVETVQW